MQMSFEDFLEELVAFINEVRGETRPEVYQAHADRIYEYYLVHQHEDVIGTLKQVLASDVELLSLVLFVIQFITEDPCCIRELQELVQREDIDIFAALDIVFQLSNISFRDHKIHLSYTDTRTVQHHLLGRIETELMETSCFLPYAQREKKRIIIATDTLLEVVHAPSRIVYRMADYLHTLGYEVMLLVNVRWQPMERSEQYCLAPYSPNYNKLLDQYTSIEYEENTYPVYQFYFSPNTMDQQKKLLDFIYQWKPLCVWYIGGSSPVQDIYRKVVTQISMGCTDGYACSEAPVLISYMQSGSDDVKESITYAKSHGQRLINIKFGSKFDRENWSLTRKELGIPEDSFALCVVGNRLDGEMSVEFIDMLQELVESSDLYHIVLIGQCKPDILRDMDTGRYSLLGFRKDLIDAIAMTDLFVNPPRLGGGGGAVRAFAVGVPVVTYPDCDVSNVTGEDFCCQDLQEMKTLIQRYASDKNYYQSQQEKVRTIYKEREKASDSVIEEVRKMLEQINDWLECGEIV